jgi:putative transposase
MDFVHDQLATGRKIRVLTVIDTFSRYSQRSIRASATGARTWCRSWRRSAPGLATLRVDQGTEFVSRDLYLWAYTKGVTLDFSRPGKPTDDAFIEAFNGRFCAECLNAHWFMSLEDALQKMEAWRR